MMTMQPSFNEIEMECRKAARGAGLSWGLAEETGQAMLWLARRGMDALPTLVSYLEEIGRDEAASDPIRSGAWIADQSRILAGGDHLFVARIRHPLLLLPFIARAVASSKRAIELSHAEGKWLWSSDRIAPEIAGDFGTRSELVNVRCRGAADAEDACEGPKPATERAALPAPPPRLAIADPVWQRLSDFARRTYVPASEQSRRFGAGAGSIDND